MTMKLTSVGLCVLCLSILGHSGSILAAERKTPTAPEDVIENEESCATDPRGAARGHDYL